MLIQQS